ncbi:MAG TPA: hypothetical protein VH352_15715 [Pseudonocardiaceae bacterium]|nr:hypothetical protein [Pseudonocardiaceae bacterium]
MAVDMADFTDPNRSSLHRTAMQNGLYELLHTAFDEAGIGWDSCEVENRGDGALILPPTSCPNTLVAEGLSQRLVVGLRRYNAIHVAEATIQLRLALHAGEVREGNGGKDGDALNHAFRILDAEEAKTDLQRRRGVLAVIVSDPFFNEVIAPDPGTEPAGFRQIPVLVKRTKDVAWLRVFSPAEPPPVDERSLVLAVLPDAELEVLREPLTDVSVPQLPTLAARATGHGVPPVQHDATAWEMVQYLTDFNAGPDGVPPVMTFVELLAGQLGGQLGADLAAWNDTQAQRMRLSTALRDIRATKAASVEAAVRLHLVILIDHDGADPDHRCVVSHWRQDDPEEWPPPRGETRVVLIEDVEREVDNVVLGAEVAWSGHQGQVALEFLLPRSLLHVPVERWRKEHASGDPQPLSLDYPVVVRSLERMRARYWHRVWGNRWRALIESSKDARVYFVGQSEIDKPYRVEAALKDERVVAIALSEPPPADPPVRDELTVALRSGVPVVLWSRGGRDAEPGSRALRALVTRLAESDGLADLPQRTLVARQAAFSGMFDELIDPEAVHSLVLLWDDPRRLVILDQPPSPRRPRGDTADERERAS